MLQLVILLVVMISVALSSCVSPAPEESSEAEPVTPVVAALVTDAQASRKSKNYHQAAAQLERALRIEPANPVLWQELAIVHVEQGSFEQAVQFASKSNSLTRDHALKKKNWQLMAYAYTQLGDKERAEEAERKTQED